MSFFDLSMRALLWRELTTTFRSGRAWLLLACCVAGPLGAVYFALPGELTPDNARATSETLFALYVVTLLIGSSLMVPPLAAITVSSERENDTFEALQLAPVTSGQIVLAKALGVFAFYLVWFMATLPIAGVVFFLVGIDTLQFTQAAVTTTLTALCCAVIGVALSARSRGTRRAIAMSYVFMFLLHGLPQLFAGALLSLGGTAILLDPQFLALSPAGVTLWSLEGFAPRTFALAAVYQLLFIYLSLRYARGLLERRDIQRSFEELVPQRQTLRLADEAKPRYHSALQRARAVSNWRKRLYAYGALVYLGISLAAMGNARLGSYREPDLGPLLIQLLPPLFVLPAAMARHFTREHARSTFDLLAMSLLTPTDLLRLQLRAGLHAMKPFLVAMAIGTLPFVALPFMQYGDPNVTIASILVHTLFTTRLYVSLLANLLVALFLTQTLSLFSRRSLPALALTVSGLLASLMFVAALIAFTEWLRFEHHSAQWLYLSLGELSPLGLLVTLDALASGAQKNHAILAAVWQGGLFFQAAVCGGLFLLSKRLLSHGHLRNK